MIRVEMPYHLRNLARVTGPVELHVAAPAYPVLRGTIRDQPSLKRRPFLRFFACEQDFSLEPYETELPAAVAEGHEPFLVIGAIAGGLSLTT
jgi:sulfur-carrier protein